MTNKELKIFASLKHKKFRLEHGLFLVEGYKTIEELLKSDLEIVRIIASEKALENPNISSLKISERVSNKDLERISNMKSASSIIAIVKIPEINSVDLIGKTILLDDIQDPGNLGTIIRTAHWFGFKQIVCSENSVDLFNHKVIQASMGAVFKMKIAYADLEHLIPDLQTEDFRVLGTFMEGESIYNFDFKNKDIFILGNEGKGISPSIEALINKKISIPSFVQNDKTESLNISIAGAVVCSEMAKKIM